MKKEIEHLQLIAEITCDHFGIKFSKLISKYRYKNLVMARSIVVYLTREYTTIPLKIIGKFIGGRDHSTISNNHKIARGYMVSDEIYLEALDRIRDEFLMYRSGDVIPYSQLEDWDKVKLLEDRVKELKERVIELSQKLQKYNGQLNYDELRAENARLRSELLEAATLGYVRNGTLQGA